MRDNQSATYKPLQRLPPKVKVIHTKKDAPMMIRATQNNNADFLLHYFLMMMLMRRMRQNCRRRLIRIRHRARERRERFVEHQRRQLLTFIGIVVVMYNTPLHDRVPRRFWVKRRLRNFWAEIYHGDLWEESDWRENLRMSRVTFERICELLRPSIQRRETRLRRPIAHHERLAVTLWKLATPIEYRTLGQKFGLGRSTISTIVHDTCKAICEILTPMYVKFPTGARLNNIVEGYNAVWGFPQCVGAIDGMHVPIKAPTENAADYYNRKHFHSIILQGVCDWKYRFTDIFFGFAGRAHDARVFANSTIYQMGITGQLLPDQPRNIAGHQVPLLLIGDPAYPLLPWLQKPFAHRGHLIAAQRRFSFRLSRARMTIENTFGRLKARWRCLLKKNDFQLENIHRIVVACCTLHNICEIHNEGVNNNWLAALREIEDNDPPLRMVNQIVAERQIDVNGANAIRNALMHHFEH